MEYGFVAFNGVKWLDSYVDHYNYLQSRIDACVAAGKVPSEEMLNSVHHIFCVYSNMYTKES
jgi:hypothetical protein